jgi:putative tryptophan/tyrosine transport system substrate-binding protein
VRVALLFNPNNASNVISRDEIETAARDLGISLVQVEASSISDLETNFGGIMSQRPDALMMPGDSFLDLQIRKIIDFLESNRIPGMFVDRDYVLAGGLMSYGTSRPDLFRRSATYGTKRTSQSRSAMSAFGGIVLQNSDVFSNAVSSVFLPRLFPLSR